MSRPAFLALPGLSVTTTLINIPCVLSHSDSKNNRPPVILIDEQDYNRLRREVLENQDDTKKSLYLLSAYENLRRRGFVQIIDYSKLYSREKQYYNLQKNQKLLNAIPDSVNRRIAEKQAEGWINYGRGEYQEAFRKSLGENLTTFDTLRRGTEKQQRKMKRGTNDPIDWNKKVLSRAIAGLTVRYHADENLKYDVQDVITGSEHKILRDFIDSSGDTSYITDIEPQITAFDSSTTTQTREILDTIGEIATDVADVQHDDWFLLGPRIAIPRYDDIFDFEIIRSQIDQGVDLDRLDREVKHVLAVLKNGAETDLPATKLQGQAEWVTEEYNLPTSSKGEPDSGLDDIVDFALNLSDYSRELRYLDDQDALSQLALFVGNSIMIDPMKQHGDNDIYRRGIELAAHLNPQSVGRMEIEEVRKQRRSDMWGENADWYEIPDRDR